MWPSLWVSRTAVGVRAAGWPRTAASRGAISLTETDSPHYAVRTEQNVLDSDATLILCRGTPSGGTELTLRLADQHGRPAMVVDLNAPIAADEIHTWLAEHAVSVLNVAGPRESQSPGIGDRATAFLEALLRRQ